MAYNKKEKLQGNIEAIKTAFRVSGSGNLSTEDREKLLRYSGFGAMKFILNPVSLGKDEWSNSDRPYYELTQELYDVVNKNADNPEGYLSSIRNSVLTSFYTPESIVQSIASVITSNAGNDITFLEPSAGRGIFIDKFKESGKVAKVTAFEKDLLTGKVLSALNPDSDIHVEGFETIGSHLNGTFDVVSSNIPFGNFRVFDASFEKGDAAHRQSMGKIHNYFFLKALDMAREGGVVAFITSRGVLDSREGRTIRESMMNNSDLVVAVRLPDGMFSEEAGTEVGSDLIILQKNTGKTALTESEQHFIDVTDNIHPETGEKYDINRYILEQEMYIADRVIAGKDPYGKACDNYLFDGNVSSLASALTTLLQGAFKSNFSKTLYDSENPQLQNAVNPVTRPRTSRESKPKSSMPVQLSLFDLLDAQEENDNSNPREYTGYIKFFYRDGILVADNGQLGTLSNVSHGTPMFTPQDYGSRGFQLLMKYIAVRDTYETLYTLEAEEQVEHPDLRGLLNRHYDDFVRSFGPFNSPKNQKAILFDVKGRDMLSIELSDPKNKQLVKSDIFHHPVSIFSKISEADNVNDALAASLNTYGGVDWEYMEELTGKSRAAMRKELGDKIYYNADGEYEIAEKFLSGNIVEKINSFPSLISEGEGYDVDEVRHSVKALEQVLPARINFEDLDLNFGERWIPTEYLEQFATSLYETPVRIQYAPNLDAFSVRANESTPKISSEYCVNGENSTVNGVELLRHALYNTVPEIKKVIGYDIDGRSIYGTDHEKVQYAASKIEQIRNEFENWVNDHDTDWKNSLADLYNSKFNCFVRAKYDGSHQTFPGLDLKTLSASKYGIKNVYQSQKDCVWMLVQNGGGICDHEVGTGKTLIMCMAAHEMKRLGVAHKPIIIGMKANVAEIAATYQRAYPGDRILYASSKDFSDRKSFFGRMKNNDYDCIIMSHDQFSKIPQSLEIQRDVMQDELEALDQALDVYRANGDMSKKLLVGLEKRKENLVARLSSINNSINNRTDDVVDFEMMGIDHIFVDESQVFKNLPFTTRDNRVSGIGNPLGSQRARNLQYAIRTIQKRSGKDLGATFLSGTTISNSLTELYLLFSYLRPKALAAQDIRSFDAWSAVFARKSRDYELNVAGQIIMKERFRHFIKTPELAAFYNEITDYRTAQDVGVERPDMTVNLVAIPPTPAHEDINKRLLEFAKDPRPELIFRSELSDQDIKAKMLIVTNTGKNASLSPRLVSPDYEEGSGTKIGVAASNIASYYERYQEQKGTQFVFCDRSTWKKDEWNAYGELRDRLVNDYGIPADEIAFIQDAGTSEAKRKEYIKKMNEGTIRILFGSTSTLGTGVNAQQRAVAVHHLDLPWKPSDLEQRNGRARRKGNEVARLYANNNVDILIYAVEKSLDSYNFYLLQAKSEFIRQLKTGNLGKRSFDQGGDSEEDGMPFAEYVAITSGNTDLLDRAKLEKNILALESEKKVFFQERSKVQRDLATTRSLLAERIERLPKYEADASRLASVSNKNNEGRYIADFKPFDELIPKDKLKDGILEAVDMGALLQDQARRLITEETQIGTVNGFPVYIRPNTEEKDKGNILVVGGEVHYRYSSGHINMSSRLLALKLLEDTINMIPMLIDRTKENIASAQKKIPELERISTKSWDKADVLSQLKKELSDLDRKIQHDMDDAIKSQEGEKEKPYTIEKGYGRHPWNLTYPVSAYPFVTSKELSDMADQYQGYSHISQTGEYIGHFKHQFAAEEVVLKIGMLNAERMKDKDWLVNHGMNDDHKEIVLASIRRLSQLGYDRYGRDLYHTEVEPSTVYTFGDYDDVRDLSHRVKGDDMKAIRLTASAMAQAIEQLGLSGKSYIVPMPSNTKKSESHTIMVANLLNTQYNMPVVDYLVELNRDEYGSMYDWKKEHPHEELPKIYFKSGSYDEGKTKGLTPIVIDNVFDTGTTSSAAVSAMKEKPVFMVLGATGNHDASKFTVQKIDNGMSIIEKLRPEGVGFTGYSQEVLDQALMNIASPNWKTRFDSTILLERAGIDKYTGLEYYLASKYYEGKTSFSRVSSKNIHDAMLSGDIRRFTEDEARLLPPMLYQIHDNLYDKASNSSFIDYHNCEHLMVLSSYLNDLVSERNQEVEEVADNKNKEDIMEKSEDITVHPRMVNLAGEMEQAEELEEQLLSDVREIIEDNDLSDEIDVTRVRIYGSRADIYSSADSDLDVLVEYDSDSWREYSLFDLLHEEEHTLRGIPVDFNPISLSKTGTIEEYLDQPHIKAYVASMQETYRRQHGEVKNMKVVDSSASYESGALHDIDISLREALITRMRHAGINIVEDKKAAEAVLVGGLENKDHGVEKARLSKVTDNERTFFEICDEAERQVKARGFDNGYAYDLGIGLGEYTYDKGNGDAFFKFIDRDGQHFEASYFGFIDEVEFDLKDAGLNRGTYEVTKEEWQRRLSETLHKTDNQNIESQNFKNWFGDWQNDSENASKVVSWNEENERVEPTVVYHGTRNGFFPVFDKDMIGSSWNADDEGFFFTESKNLGEDYTKPVYNGQSGEPHLFDVYLDIKKPLVIDKKWYAANYNNRRISDHDAVEIWDDNREDILEAKNNGDYDGIIIDTTGYGARQPKMYVVFEPEQIKSASLNIGQWSKDNADIRYFKMNDGGHAYGFVKGDTIYIDPAIATSETPLHEYSHLWASAMRQYNPSEWKNIVELMKGSPEIWEKVQKDYPELKDDDAIADEVLAQYSGKRGYERLMEAANEVEGKEPEGILVSVLEALEKFWASVSSFLSIHYTSKEQVADQILRDSLAGINPLSVRSDIHDLEVARNIKGVLSETSNDIPLAIVKEYESWESALKEHQSILSSIADGGVDSTLDEQLASSTAAVEEKGDILHDAMLSYYGVADATDKEQLRLRLSEIAEKFTTSNAVYTGLFVQDKESLLEAVVPKYNNVYGHHLTTSWKPDSVDTLGLGEEGVLHVRGRLTTADADILLLDERFDTLYGTPLMESVRGSRGVKTFDDIPHITLSTRDGVNAYQSNAIVKEYTWLQEEKWRYEGALNSSEEALHSINERLSSFHFEPLDIDIKVKSGAFMRGGKVAYSVEDIFPYTLVNNEESYKKNVNQQENSIKFMKFVNTGKEIQNESYESSANIELDKVIRAALSARFGNKEVDDILQHRDYTYQNTVSGDATGKPVKITVNNLSSNVVDDIFIVKSVFGENVIDNETVRDLASLELRNIMAHSSSILPRSDSEDNVLTYAVKYYADVLMNIVKNDDSAEARKVLEAYHPYNEIKERYHEAVEMLHDEDGFHLTDLGYRDRWVIERTSSLEEMRDYDMREIEKALIDYLYLNNRNRSLIDSPHVRSTDNTVSFAGKVEEADNLIQEAIDSIPRSEFKVYEDYLIADSLDDGKYHPNEQDIMDEIVSKLAEVGVKVETDIEVGKSILKEQLGIGDDGEKVLRTADGERVIGFAYDGVVYLDTSVATVETPLHEYTHLWAESIRQCAPEKWNRIVKIMKGDDTADLKEVLKDYPELHAGGEINDDVIEEALARYSGRYGRQKLLEDSEKTEGEQTVIVPQTFVEKVTAALHEFWKSVQDILGITEKRPFVGENILEARTASDIADIILSDLYNDKDLPHVISVSESPRFQKAISNVNKVTWNGSLDVYSSNSFIPVRHMSLAVKKGDESAIKKAGDILTRIVERIPGHADAVLVPIPNRSGKAEYTLRMAEEISNKTGLAVADILTGTPHKPIYEKKGDNGNDGLHLMRYDLKGELPEGKKAILVDNVLDTGTTAMSALRTLGEDSKLVVLGSTSNYRKYNYPVSVHISPVITETFTKSRASDIKSRIESTYQQLFKDKGLGFDIHGTVRSHEVSSWNDAESLARKLSQVMMFQRQTSEAENVQVKNHAHDVITGIYQSETRYRLMRDAGEQFGEKASKSVEDKLTTNDGPLTEQDFKAKLVDIMEDMDKNLLRSHLENTGRIHEVIRLSEQSPAPSAAITLDGDSVSIELGSVSELTSGQGTISYDTLDAASRESVMAQLLTGTTAINQKALYIDNYDIVESSAINIQQKTEHQAMANQENNTSAHIEVQNPIPQWTREMDKELDRLMWEPGEDNDRRIAELRAMRESHNDYLAAIKTAKEIAASNEGRSRYYVSTVDSYGQRDGGFRELWLKPEDITEDEYHTKHFRNQMLHDTTFGDSDIPNQGVMHIDYHPEIERNYAAKEFMAYDLNPLGGRIGALAHESLSEEEAQKYLKADYSEIGIKSVAMGDNYNIRVLPQDDNTPSPRMTYATFYAPEGEEDLAAFEIKPLVEYANAKLLSDYIEQHRDKNNPASLGFALENKTTGARWEVYPVTPSEGGRKNTFAIWTNEDSFKSGEMTGLRGNGWSAEAVNNKLSEVRARWIKDSESQTANVKLWDIKGAVPTQEVRTAINAPVPTVEQQSSRMEKYLSVKETIVAAVDKLGADSGIKLEISDYDDEYNLSVTTGSGERFYAKYEKSPSDISLYEKGHEGTSTEEVTASEWQDAVLEAITRQESLSVKEEQSHAEEKPAVVIENARVIRQTKGADVGKWSILATINGEQYVKPLAYKDREAYFAKDKDGKRTNEVTPQMLAEKYFPTIPVKNEATLVVSDNGEAVTGSKKFENIVILRDEAGKYAMFTKPEGERGYAVYPSRDDLAKFFESVNSGDVDKKEEVKKSLAEKYLVELEKDPSIKADIFHENIDPAVVAQVSSVKTEKDKTTHEASIVATINGEQQEPRPISPSQWQRIWLSGDRNAYNKRLAAVVYGDVINKNIEKTHGVTSLDLLTGALEQASNEDGILVNTESKAAPHIYGKSTSLPAMTSLLLAMHSDRYGYSTNAYTHIHEAKQRLEHIKQGNKSVEVAMTTWDTYQSKSDTSKIISRQDYKKLDSAEKKDYVAQPSEVPHKLFNIDQTTMQTQNEVAYNTEVSERGTLPERINAGNVPEDNKTMLDVNKFILSVRDNLVPIVKGEDVKGYDKDSDKIVIPGRDKYGDYESYAQDIFRFTVEATGHEGRLNRVASVAGSEKEGIDSAHAHEQLVVELASAIKMLDLGLPARISEGNKALIPIWQENLRNNETYLNLVSSDVTSALAMISQAERGKKVEKKTVVTETPSEQSESSITPDMAANEEAETTKESKSENAVQENESKMDAHASMILSALSGAKENTGIWLNHGRKAAPSLYNHPEYQINPFNTLIMALCSDANEYKTNVYTSFSEAKKNGYSVKGHETALPINWFSWNTYVNKYDKSDTITNETYDKLPKEEKGFYKAVPTKEKRYIYNVDQTILKHSNESAYAQLVTDNTTSSLAKDTQRSNDQEAFALSEKMNVKHPEALILIRMNDRYCAFGNNAVNMANVLKLEKQEVPDVSQDKNIAVKACFDYEKLDTNLPLLIRAGNRVAMCDFTPTAIRTVDKDGSKVFEKIDNLGAELKKLDKGVSVTKAKNTSYNDGKLTICTNRQAAPHTEYETAIQRLNQNYRNVILYTGASERLGRDSRNDILPEDLSKYNNLVSELAAGVLMLREGFPARLKPSTIEDVKYWEREFKEDPRLLARLENDINNAVEVVVKIQEGEGKSIDYAKLRGEKHSQILNPNDYVIVHELANHPNLESRNIVLVKDVKNKSVDVILPEGASLKMGEDVSGMNKNRIARALEKEGFLIENISWYNASGAHALHQPDEYFKGKTIEVSRLKQYALTPLTRLDFTKELANVNQVGITDVRMIRDDAGKWAMYIKPDKPLMPFAVYPENKDATKLFVALKSGDPDGLQAVKEELGRHYVNVVANHPEFKTDFLMPKVPDGVDINKIEKVYVHLDAQTNKAFIMPAIDGKYLPPKDISKEQFNRMWLAGDMKEYKTALAAVMFKEELSNTISSTAAVNQQGESEKPSQAESEDSPRRESEQRKTGFKAGR